MTLESSHDDRIKGLLGRHGAIGNVSIGLAAGYFYNFISPISNEVNRDEFRVYDDRSTDSDSMAFDSEDVYMDVIIPTKLDMGVFDRCVTEFKNTRNGFVYLPANKRFYGVNFAINDLGKKKTLSIIDLARPIMCVKQFYETVGPIYKEHGKTWEEVEAEEVKAFKDMLLILQRMGYGSFVNRLQFRERS